MKKVILSIFCFIAILLFASPAFAFVSVLVSAAIGAVVGALGIGGLTIISGALIYGGLAAATWGLSKIFASDMPSIGFDSSTYSGNLPVVTINKGTPVPISFGLCRLAGNIVRQNDLIEGDWIKVIVCHGMGEWDEIITHYVNNIKWGALKNTNHAKWSHLGTSTQTGITNVFTEGASNYRNKVISEYKISKGDEISQLQNINVIARTMKCLEIGEDLGGTASWTNNPAQIMWHWYVAIEKLTAAELDNNAFLALEEYCGTPMSYDDEFSSVYQPLPVPEAAQATSVRTFYHEYFSLEWLNLTGSGYGTGWMSSDGSTTEQRLNIDLGMKRVITGISLVNYHSAGTDTDVGIQNFVLQGSNTASDFAHVAYSDATWSNIAAGLSADEHTAADEIDEEYIPISNDTAYRYISLKIADNHGDANYMGLLGIRFWRGGASSLPSVEEDNVKATFDYTFDTKIEINDAKKIIWQSFFGKCIQSQGTIKPVWDGAKEHDGAGSLQNKAVAHIFNTDTNVVKDSFRWQRLESPNVFIINFINQNSEFKKDMVQMRDEEDIVLRGEKVYEENCWYIIDPALAKRRCRRLYNKARYCDYGCQLTGFPDSQDVEVYDRVTVEDDEAGFTAKDFIITDKREDQYGRSVFTMESWLSGVYNDGGFVEQPGYGINAPNPYAPLRPVDSTGVTVTNVPPGAAVYAAGAISVIWTIPTESFYSHTEIWVSTDDSTYYYAGQDSDGAFFLNGLGTFYDYGDTVYVKLVNVTPSTKSAMPSSADGSVAISEDTKIASFYFGQYDMWAGNAAIDNAATAIVIGGLDGTAKIALGASADTMTAANMSTYPGFFADGSGDIRAGGSTHGILFDQASGIFYVNPKMRVGSGGTYIDIDGTNQRIRSSNYASGATGTGFTLDPDLLEVGNIAARGILRTSVFQKDSISAHAGSDGVFKGADVLSTDMTALDNSSLVLEGNDTFDIGDILRVKEGLDDEWLEVTNLSWGEVDDETGCTAFRVSLIDGAAFVWMVGVSFSSYQDGNYRIILHDSATKTATGYISSVAPVGETLGSELIVDGNFETLNLAAAKTVLGITQANPGVVTFDTGHGYVNGDVVYFYDLTEMTELNTEYWKLRANAGDTFELTTVWDTTSLDTSGYGAAETTGGACVKLVDFTHWTEQAKWEPDVDGAGALTNKVMATDVANNIDFYQNKGVINFNKLYKVIFTVSDYVKGGVFIRQPDQSPTTHQSDDTYTEYIAAVVTEYLSFRASGAATTLKIDDVSIKQVTDPPSSGARIVSTADGSTQNWANIDSGFDMGDVVSFEIESANSYTVTRDKASMYAADTNPIWTKGATVINYGQTGGGGVYMTASEYNAPYLSVFVHSGSPWTDLMQKIRLGNLNGFAGYTTDIYGLAIYEDANNYLKFDPTNSIQIGVDTANAITIRGGGDILLEGDDADPGALMFEGTSYAVMLSTNTAGDTYSIIPTTDKVVSLEIGSATKRFKEIDFFAINRPNPAATDQGLTGDNDTMKYYVDTVGANNATIYLDHDSDNATTTYTVSTNETIPTNVKLNIENGALISVSNGITLTIYSYDNVIAQPNQHIFTGEGTVVFTRGGTALFLDWWGAKNDNSTNCSPAFISAFAAMPGAVNEQGSTLKLLAGGDGYKCNTTMTIPTKGKIVIDGCGAAEVVAGMTDGTNLFEPTHDANVVFQHLQLIGNADAGHGFYSSDSTNCFLFFNGVRISGFTNSGKWGIYVDNEHMISIRDCRIRDNANGVFIKHTQSGGVISGNNIAVNATTQLSVELYFGDVTGNLFDTPSGGAAGAEVVKWADSGGVISGNKFGDNGSSTPANAVWMLHITKTSQTYGSLGTAVYGNHFEYDTDYDGTKCPIYITEAANGISIHGNEFLNRSADNFPVYIDSVDSDRVLNIEFGADNYWIGQMEPVKIADTTATGITITGLRYRDYHFQLDNLAAGQTNQALNIFNASETFYYLTQRSFLVGISVICSEAIAEGETLTISPSVGEGVAIDWSQVVAATEQREATMKEPLFTKTFGGETRCLYTTTDNGSWSATTDVSVVVTFAEWFMTGHAIAY